MNKQEVKSEAKIVIYADGSQLKYRIVQDGSKCSAAKNFRSSELRDTMKKAPLKVQVNTKGMNRVQANSIISAVRDCKVRVNEA